MAYITRYNFSRMQANRHAIGKGLMMENQEQLLYPHRIIDWFNDLEATRLFLCKVLLLEQDHALFTAMLGKHWLKIITPEDDFTHAVAPKKPSYHIDVNCSALHTPEFRDFELPVGFLETYGVQGVQAFRRWLHQPHIDGKKPIDVFANDPQRFKTKCEALWTRVSWHGVVLNRRQNSGVHLFHNYSLAEVSAHIDGLLAQYDQWLDSLQPMERDAVVAFKRRSSQQGLSFRGLDTERVSELLAHFKAQFKVPMREALLAYYYQTATESRMDMVSDNVLEHLGFEPCGYCCGHSQTDAW